ncbi:MAG: dihydroorotase [Candidatus Omnitrophica bacterium]|nr:dihydroorotase [Candidatus Omnitrophota bacterium]
MKLLIKNATLVNTDEIIKANLLIENGKIAGIGKDIQGADKEIDAKGKYVFPGFVDLHTHLRTPGKEGEEDILSGSTAAAKGGFTTIFCMPNTEPAIDNEGLVKWVREESQSVGLIDIYPVGAITINRAGKELTEFGALKKAGCLALSDDGFPVDDTLVLRRAYEYAKMFDLLIISHCEDSQLSRGGSMRESFISSKYGIAGIPDIAESLIVARDIELAKYLDAKIHLAHISSAKSLEIIKRAKKEGVKVTAETCPHYFTLTIEDIEREGFQGNFKVNPPLGDKKDLAAIKKALADGTIDCIATDHAPHSLVGKELPFELAPFGFIGLELAFSLTNSYLIKDKTLDLKDLTSKLSTQPAAIAGLSNCGKIAQGYVADLVIADLEGKWKVEEENIASKSKNTPFLGQELEGTIEHTIKRGKVIYSRLKD